MPGTTAALAAALAAAATLAAALTAALTGALTGALTAAITAAVMTATSTVGRTPAPPADKAVEKDAVPLAPAQRAVPLAPAHHRAPAASFPLPADDAGDDTWAGEELTYEEAASYDEPSTHGAAVPDEEGAKALRCQNAFINAMGMRVYKSQEPFKDKTVALAMRALLKKQNVICITACGSGKTSLYLLPALVAPRTTTVVVIPFSALKSAAVAEAQAAAMQSGVPTFTAGVWSGTLPAKLPSLLFAGLEDCMSPSFVDAIISCVRAQRVATVVFEETHVHLTHALFRRCARHARWLSDRLCWEQHCNQLFLSGTFPGDHELFERQQRPGTSFATFRGDMTFEHIDLSCSALATAAGMSRALLAEVTAAATAHGGGDGIFIVFVPTRRDVDSVASLLRALATSLGPLATRLGWGLVQYHSQLDAAVAQSRLGSIGKSRCLIISTSALGQGLNYDVQRVFVFRGLPDKTSLVQAVQRAGRMPRNGRPRASVRVLLCADINDPQQRFVQDVFDLVADKKGAQLVGRSDRAIKASIVAYLSTPIPGKMLTADGKRLLDAPQLTSPVSRVREDERVLAAVIARVKALSASWCGWCWAHDHHAYQLTTCKSTTPGISNWTCYLQQCFSCGAAGHDTTGCPSRQQDQLELLRRIVPHVRAPCTSCGLDDDSPIWAGHGRKNDEGAVDVEGATIGQVCSALTPGTPGRLGDFLLGMCRAWWHGRTAQHMQSRDGPQFRRPMRGNKRAAVNKTTGRSHADWSAFRAWLLSREHGRDLPHLYHLCGAYFADASQLPAAGTPLKLRFTWRLT